LTAEEWDREVGSIYEEKIQGIVISSSITESDIKELISKIDDLLNTAFFDYSRAKSAYESQDRNERATTKEYFVMYKDEGNTDRMSDSLAVKKVKSEGVISRVNEARRRYNFMQVVVDLLRAKRDMLITDSGVLKLEASLK